jgi:hypothetical protein
LGDRKTFGPSTVAPGVLAFSRILSESESVIAVNTDTTASADVSVLVDAVLNPAGASFATMYSSVATNRTCPVEQIPDATVIGNGISHGTIHSVRLSLAPGEALIVARQ